jgi:hypothetical protein
MIEDVVMVLAVLHQVPHHVVVTVKKQHEPLTGISLLLLHHLDDDPPICKYRSK